MLGCTYDGLIYVAAFKLLIIEKLTHTHILPTNNLTVYVDKTHQI